MFEKFNYSSEQINKYYQAAAKDLRNDFSWGARGSFIFVIM